MLKKFRNMICAAFILTAAVQFGLGQEEPLPVKVSEFGKVCSEYFMAVFDQFLISLNNDPQAKGYVVFYGDQTTEGRNLQYIDAVKGYAFYRGESDRLLFC